MAYRRPFVLASCLYGLSCSLLPGAACAGEAPAAAEEPLETVIITGIRANLEKSLELKRNSAVVMDSINSTELGRFPDADVADSLAHLPGITLQRTTGGDGQKVNIRGLASSYNLITMNGRLLATDDDARDLAFDVLPAEVITGADVLKSPEASAVEGSIGGTVNLRTASPLENPGLHYGIHAEGNRNSMTHLNGTKYSAYVEDSNSERTLGFVLGAVHSADNDRSDSLNAYSQADWGVQRFPFDAPPGDPNAIPIVAAPCCITFGSIFDHKKRDAISGSLEWRPSSTLKLAVDGLYTKLDDPQIGYNQSYYFPSDEVGTGWTNPTIKDGVVTAVTVANFQPEMVNNTMNRQVTTSLAGLSADWQPREGVTYSANLYRSTANRPEGGQDTFVTAGLVSPQSNALDTLYLTDLPHSLPSLNVVVPPSQFGLTACPAGTVSATDPTGCSYTALMNSGYLNDNKYWSTHYVGLNGYSVHDRVNGLNLDGAWDVHAGVVERFKLGVAITDREKSRTDRSNDWINGSGQYGTLYLTAGGTVQPNPYSFAYGQGFNVVSLKSIPNFMQGAGGAYPSVLTQIDATQLLAFLKSLDGLQNPFYCTSNDTADCAPNSQFSLANTLPQANPFNSYAVTEKTFSLYGQADFRGERWSGNIGLRLVRTRTTAATVTAAPSYLWTNSTDASTVQTWNVQYGSLQPVDSKGEYTFVLPALNFNFWLQPDRLQLRFATAQTMARPNLNQLAPTSTNNALNGEALLFYDGKAGLRPIKATQADLSLEWYYRRHDMLSVAVFIKQLRDDIFTVNQENVDLGTLQYVGGPPGTPGVVGTPFIWTVQSPTNGGTSTFKGIELTWQHILDNGFGVHLQFTHTDDGSGVNGAPANTESVGLIYDRGGSLSADLNWDHASSYAARSGESTDISGWPAIADAFEWMTASAHYKFGDGFEVYAEGRNLTNSVARTYLNGNPLLPWAPGQSIGQSSSGTGFGYTAYGRSYFLGLSYRH